MAIIYYLAELDWHIGTLPGLPDCWIARFRFRLLEIKIALKIALALGLPFSLIKDYASFLQIH